MQRVISDNYADYNKCDDSAYKLSKLKRNCFHFEVSHEIRVSDEEKIKILRISSHLDSLESKEATIISFNKLSEIDVNPAYFICLCKLMFIFPSRVKRVKRLSNQQKNKKLVLKVRTNLFQ